jgi:hypothetical protein
MQGYQDYFALPLGVHQGYISHSTVKKQPLYRNEGPGLAVSVMFFRFQVNAFGQFVGYLTKPLS